MLFDNATLAAFRKVQESTMMHECEIEPYIVGEDGTISYGEPVKSICGFNGTAGSLSSGAMWDAVQADAEMRLPYSVPVGMRDRVTLLSSFGTVLEPPRHYEVCELPDSFGPSGQVVKLKEVYT